MSQSAQIKTADAPFDDLAADIILRTSDNVDFHCHRAFLSYASPSFFGGMFPLPQPPTPSAADEMKDGIPVLLVTETSSVMKGLLTLCYPSFAASSSPLSDTDFKSNTALLEACNKYAMEGVMRMVLEMFAQPRVVEKQPLQVYALACCYRLPNEARIAAQSTLRVSSKELHAEELE